MASALSLLRPPAPSGDPLSAFLRRRPAVSPCPPPEDFQGRMIWAGISTGIAAAEQEAARPYRIHEDLDLLDAKMVRSDCVKVLIW